MGIVIGIVAVNAIVVAVIVLGGGGGGSDVVAVVVRLVDDFDSLFKCSQKAVKLLKSMGLIISILLRRFVCNNDPACSTPSHQQCSTTVGRSILFPPFVSFLIYHFLEQHLHNFFFNFLIIYELFFLYGIFRVFQFNKTSQVYYSSFLSFFHHSLLFVLANSSKTCFMYLFILITILVISIMALLLLLFSFLSFFA